MRAFNNNNMRRAGGAVSPAVAGPIFGSLGMRMPPAMYAEVTVTNDIPKRY